MIIPKTRKCINILASLPANLNMLRRYEVGQLKIILIALKINAFILFQNALWEII